GLVAPTQRHRDAHRDAPVDPPASGAKRRAGARERTPPGAHPPAAGKPQRARDGDPEAVEAASPRRDDVHPPRIAEGSAATCSAAVNSSAARASVFASTAIL